MFELLCSVHDYDVYSVTLESSSFPELDTSLFNAALILQRDDDNITKRSGRASKRRGRRRSSIWFEQVAGNLQQEVDKP